MKHLRHLKMSFFLQFSFCLQNLLFLVHLKSIFQPEEWNVAFSCFFLLIVPTSLRRMWVNQILFFTVPCSCWLWAHCDFSGEHCWGPACDTLVGVGAVTGQEPPPPWRRQICLQCPWVRSQAALNLNLRASSPDLVVFRLLTLQEHSHYLHLYICMPFPLYFFFF